MPLPNTNSDIWQTKAGGGCASLFGLPFFLAGIGVIVATFIPADVRGGDEMPLYFGIPFGGIFALVGGAILFVGMNLTLDRATGAALKQWTVFSKPIYSKSRSLKEFDRIVVRSEIRRSKNSSYTVYPVRLLGDGVDAFEISQSREKSKARTESEEIAKFLNLPIHDESSGSLRIRESDALDLSVKEKFATGKETNEIPDPPATLKSSIDYDGTRLNVAIPPLGLNAGFVIAFLAISVFEIFFISVFALPFLEDVDSDSFALPIFAVFGLMFLGIPTLILLALVGNTFLARQSVSVSADAISVTRGWPFKKSVTIPSDAVEELFIGSETSYPGLASPSGSEEVKPY